MIKNITLIAAVFLVFSGCETGTWQSGFTQMGYKPVYVRSGELKDLIKSTAPQALTETGKIYVKGNYLLVNRPFAGIHVFDNSDPANPVNLAFLEIPGNMDVSMKGNFLYADYIGKIAVIDVTDIQKPRVTQTVAIDTQFQNYPPTDLQGRGTWRTYFECPDPSKGIVVGWSYTQLNSPKCWRDRE